MFWGLSDFFVLTMFLVVFQVFIFNEKRRWMRLILSNYVGAVLVFSTLTLQGFRLTIVCVFVVVFCGALHTLPALATVR